MDQPNATSPVTQEHMHHHVNKLTLLILVAILVLAAGEYYLYRQQIHIKSMVSEGIMQLKEELKAPPSPTPAYTTPSPSLPVKK